MTLQDSLKSLSDSLISNFQHLSQFFLPALLATLTFILGTLVALLLTSIWKGLSDFLTIEKTLTKSSTYKNLEKINFNLTLTNFITFLIWWITILLFSLGALGIAGFDKTNQILAFFWGFLPKVATAFVILFLGIFFAYFVYLFILAIATLSKLPFKNLLASALSAVIIIFSSTLALFALGLNQNIVTALGLAALVAVTLAFGLAGKELAEKFLKEIRN